MKYPLIILAVATMAGACKSKKKPLVQNETKNFDSLVFNNNTGQKDSLLRKNWEYFSSRMVVDFNSAEQELSGTVSLRMRRDSIIWFSASAALGIQVAKGIITRDSVKMLDLFEKKYYRFGIKKLSEMFGAEIGLRELQNLIIGNPVFDTMTYALGGWDLAWFAVQEPLSNVIYSKDFSLPDSSYISQKGSTRQIKVKYQGSKNTENFSIAEKMLILALSDAKTVRIGIEFTTATNAFIPSYPFVVPEGYELQE